MSARKRSAAADLPTRIAPERRAALQRNLAQCTTNTGLVDALQELHGAGVLDRGLIFNLRKRLSHAKKEHSAVSTPYGKAVQHIDFPCRSYPRWEISHPLAILYYLCSLSSAFYTIMESSLAAAGGVLSGIIYIDEVCPGNALRHDKGRTFQAVYRAFTQWPAWLLAHVLRNVVGVMIHRLQIVGTSD